MEQGEATSDELSLKCVSDECEASVCLMSYRCIPSSMDTEWWWESLTDIMRWNCKLGASREMLQVVKVTQTHPPTDNHWECWRLVQVHLHIYTNLSSTEKLHSLQIAFTMTITALENHSQLASPNRQWRGLYHLSGPRHCTAIRQATSLSHMNETYEALSITITDQ